MENGIIEINVSKHWIRRVNRHTITTNIEKRHRWFEWNVFEIGIDLINSC